MLQVLLGDIERVQDCKRVKQKLPSRSVLLDAVPDIPSISRLITERKPQEVVAKLLSFFNCLPPSPVFELWIS